MSFLIPKTKEDMLKHLAFGATMLYIAFALQSCIESSERIAARDAEEDKRQTPAVVQANAEKDLKARGFSDVNYNSHKRVGRQSEMSYSAKREGMTYLVTAWCDSQKCGDSPRLEVIRSEPAEAKAAALWKQNGYEVVSYGRFTLSYDHTDSTMEAVVTKDGRRYLGNTECAGDKCRITKMAATF